ncbi:GNAT family protein [Streptomyces mangrovisoli]|uniref:GNAT family N-acetyltransferase n=1 Tax=Streptomyces mangrovisoli TaxID=1428628 RepID=UPI0030B80940
MALDPHQQRGATVGFAPRPDRRGVGYGRATVVLLLAVAFDDLGLHRVWGAMSPLNTASARTMETTGVTEQGTNREHVLKAGRWRDSVPHAILDREVELSPAPASGPAATARSPPTAHQSTTQPDQRSDGPNALAVNGWRWDSAPADRTR